MSDTTLLILTPFIALPGEPSDEGRRYRLAGARPPEFPAGPGRLVITVSESLRWHDESQGVMASPEQDLDFTGPLDFENDHGQFRAFFREGSLTGIRRLS